MADNQVSRFRWAFRYSLQSLLVLTALVAAFFGGRSTMLPALRAQERKQAALQAHARQVEAQLALRQYQAELKVLQLQVQIEEARAQRRAEERRQGNESFSLGSPEAWHQFRQ